MGINTNLNCIISSVATLIFYSRNLLNKVSDRLLCQLASSFYQECLNVAPEAADSLASSSMLSDLHRLSTTKHENEAGKTMEKQGLACPIKVQKIDIGLTKLHPVLRIPDMLETLSSQDKMQYLLGSRGQDPSAMLAKFWRRYRQEHPSHEVFAVHGKHLDSVIPLQLHADEGQTLKNSGLMVISFQFPIGSGVSTQDDPSDMPLNYLGSSFKTRFLISVLLKRMYLKRVKKSLDNLLAIVAEDLKSLFEHGIQLQFAGRRRHCYIAWIGLKGDWPIHAKAGHLKRHYARATKDPSKCVGICHLCKAGVHDIPMHDFLDTANWRPTYLSEPPFLDEGPLARIPQTREKELMFRFDPFHTLHKGCFAELAGSGLVESSVVT